MTIRKRAMIRVISFAAAIVTVLIMFVIVSHNEMVKFRTDIEYNYGMHLSELDGSVYNISLALRKAMYASSATQFSTLAAELSAESTVAKNSLSQLPSAESELSTVNRFLSQVGDYTVYLSKKVISGGSISDEERESLHTLATTASNLSATISTVRSQYDKDGVWTEELSNNIGSSVGNGFASDLLELEEMLSDYPTLVYDGPFSDHMLSGTAKMLQNLTAVTAEEARAKALSVCGGEISGFESEAESDGKIATYDFTSGDMSVSVSKLGGYVVYMRKYRTVEAQNITYEQAVETAESYLNSSSGMNFTSTYYFAEEGVCVVNLAYKEGSTVCYPDLIKVGVALDTGEVVLLEAAGFISNHYIRNINTPKYTADEAEEVLSEVLDVQSVRRAVIPTDGNSEKHCYEFTCKGIDGEELLVYVNVENLEEEKILLLLKTDGGTLTK